MQMCRPAGRTAVRPGEQRTRPRGKPVGLADGTNDETVRCDERRVPVVTARRAHDRRRVVLMSGQQAGQRSSRRNRRRRDVRCTPRAARAVICADLGGRNEAPQLAGNNFMNTWRSRSAKDLFEYIQSTMPPTGANLGEAQYLAVTTYILQANGAQAGSQAFNGSSSASIGSIATGAGAGGRARSCRCRPAAGGTTSRRAGFSRAPADAAARLAVRSASPSRAR